MVRSLRDCRPAGLGLGIHHGSLTHGNSKSELQLGYSLGRGPSREAGSVVIRNFSRRPRPPLDPPDSPGREWVPERHLSVHEALNDNRGQGNHQVPFSPPHFQITLDSQQTQERCLLQPTMIQPTGTRPLLSQKPESHRDSTNILRWDSQGGSVSSAILQPPR